MNVLTVLLSISCIPREWADYSAWSWNIFRAWIWKSWWCKLHNWSINHTGPRKQFIGNIEHDDWATGMLCSHLAVNLQLLSRIKAARLQLWIPFGNKISFWLQNYGPWFDIVPAGIYSVIVDGFMQSVHDISSGVWTYQVVKYIFTQLHINQPYQSENMNDSRLLCTYKPQIYYYFSSYSISKSFSEFQQHPLIAIKTIDLNSILI